MSAGPGLAPASARAAGLPSYGPVPLLAVEGVSKAFGARRAVVDVTLDLWTREFAAVLGPSGAGKSTVFGCVTGLVRPDAGRVRFTGRDVTTLPPDMRRQIAVVFQGFHLVRRLTAHANVLAGRLGHVPTWRGVLRRFERADELRAFECLERVGLLDCAHQRADTLSGGQQQRVAIARALAQGPRLIVADEPVASLDPSAAAGILQLLSEIARDDGVAVLCSLHQVGYARRFADRIIGLSHGRIVLDAATGALRDADFAALYGGEAAGPRPAAALAAPQADPASPAAPGGPDPS